MTINTEVRGFSRTNKRNKYHIASAPEHIMSTLMWPCYGFVSFCISCVCGLVEADCKAAVGLMVFFVFKRKSVFFSFGALFLQVDIDQSYLVSVLRMVLDLLLSMLCY